MGKRGGFGIGKRGRINGRKMVGLEVGEGEGLRLLKKGGYGWGMAKVWNKWVR